MDAAESEPGERPETGSLLELRHAAKSFGAVQALTDGSVTLLGGEVHALLGENGAGKSTLVKILAGVHQPDAGTLTVNGREVTLNGPAAAREAGIAVIYQEPTLFPDLTVAENMFIGRQPVRSGRRIAGPRIDRHAMQGEAAAIFKRLGVPLNPARIARGLSIADQQVVEIGKALSLDARVIVMDEPTAALSAAEVDRLFEVIRTLKSQNAAVLFISHRLEEVFEICQTVTVMRDGKHVLSSDLAGLTANDLVRAMVGRELAERPPDAVGATPGGPVLTVERLTREGVFTGISFTVRAGEIVALAGLVGSGRSEVARAVFGIDRYDAGQVTVHGKQLKKASPTSAMAAGIGFVPEDRRQQGLVMDMSIQQNVALASLGNLRKGGLIRKEDVRWSASASSRGSGPTGWTSTASGTTASGRRCGPHWPQPAGVTTRSSWPPTACSSATWRLRITGPRSTRWPPPRSTRGGRPRCPSSSSPTGRPISRSYGSQRFFTWIREMTPNA